jgi:putative ABC transport system substrate-binding protein
LRDLGYIEGTNIIIEYRWAEDNYSRLPQLAAELIRSNVEIIVTHGTPGSLAAKQATGVIPIVIAIIGDPVAAGVVSSLARPGANITGQSYFNPELRVKRIELLREMMPRITSVGIIVNPDNPAHGPEYQMMETIAKSLKVNLQQYIVRGPNEFEAVFGQMEGARSEAVETGDDAIVNANVGAVAAWATKGRIPSAGNVEFARAGGLIGYGVEFVGIFRHAAVFVDKILKGAKPADLPIEQATKFETVLNLRTAKVLGLDIPTATLLRADEVIEQ